MPLEGVALVLRSCEVFGSAGELAGMREGPKNTIREADTAVDEEKQGRV